MYASSCARARVCASILMGVGVDVGVSARREGEALFLYHVHAQMVAMHAMETVERWLGGQRRSKVMDAPRLAQ